MILILNLSHRSILCSTETSQRDSTQSFPNLLPLHRTLPAKRQAFSPPCIGICHFLAAQWPKSSLCHAAWFSRVDLFCAPRCKHHKRHDSEKESFWELSPNLCAKHSYNATHIQSYTNEFTCCQTVQLDHHSKCLRLTVVWAKFDIIHIVCI